MKHFLRGGGNPKRVHFVLRNRALRFIFSEHFVLRIIDGNGKNALDGFWERLGKDKEHIQAVCTDLSAVYTRAVSEHLPNAALVVDHFHVTKLMNEKLDLLRR